jgi:hypothetical protein
LRFDPGAISQRAQPALTPLRVEGAIRHPPSGGAWEYSVVLAVRNGRGEEITRQVVGVGALLPAEERTFTLSVEVFVAQDAQPASPPARPSPTAQASPPARPSPAPQPARPSPATQAAQPMRAPPGAQPSQATRPSQVTQASQPLPARDARPGAKPGFPATALPPRHSKPTRSD